MKIQVASDFHLELRSKTKFKVLPEADVLVLAGDFHNRPASLRKFFKKLIDQNDIPIIYVLGNHEYYYRVFPNALEEYQDVCKEFSQVHLLEKSTVTLGGIRFIGTTLFSDLSNPFNAFAATAGVTDFKYSKEKARPVIMVKGSYDGMTPYTWTQEWRRCRTFLVEALHAAYEAKDPTVVVTHFAPTGAVHPEYFRTSHTRAAFESELSTLMEMYKPKLWVYGHDHGPHVDRMIYDTRVVCNQKGYYHEKDRSDYKPWIVNVE